MQITGTAVREGETPAWAHLRQQIERLESQYHSTLRRIDEIEEQLKNLASNDDRVPSLNVGLAEKKKKFTEVWSELTSLYSRRDAMARC